MSEEPKAHDRVVGAFTGNNAGPQYRFAVRMLSCITLLLAFFSLTLVFLDVKAPEDGRSMQPDFLIYGGMCLVIGFMFLTLARESVIYFVEDEEGDRYWLGKFPTRLGDHCYATKVGPDGQKRNVRLQGYFFSWRTTSFFRGPNRIHRADDSMSVSPLVLKGQGKSGMKIHAAGDKDNCISVTDSDLALTVINSCLTVKMHLQVLYDLVRLIGKTQRQLEGTPKHRPSNHSKFVLTSLNESLLLPLGLELNVQHLIDQGRLAADTQQDETPTAPLAVQEPAPTAS